MSMLDSQLNKRRHALHEEAAEREGQQGEVGGMMKERSTRVEEVMHHDQPQHRSLREGAGPRIRRQIG